MDYRQYLLRRACQLLGKRVGRRFGTLSLHAATLMAAARMGMTAPGGNKEKWALLEAFVKIVQAPDDAPAPVPTRSTNVAHKRTRRTIRPASDAFLNGYEWRALRMKVLVKYGPRCMCCGATAENGRTMHVDHIKPRRVFPELALDESNLQVLCDLCNHGKGNWDQTDWRPAAPVDITTEQACAIWSRLPKQTS